MTTDIAAFYFGSLSDDERLDVERRMLTDPEILLDYLDFKRGAEGALQVPQSPSPAVWARLRSRVVITKRVSWIVGLGLAAAAASLTFILSRPHVETAAPSDSGKILFDSGSEQFGHSNVL